MPIPDAKRVVYGKNPLDTVICQLRFPPILKIEKEIPDKFQDSIRKEFPGFIEREELALPMPQQMINGIPQEVFQQVIPSGNKNYEFSSEDSHWKINLTRTFIALSTKDYKQWENFRQKLERPLEALISIYEPAHFSRIGLRYIDIINRSKLNLTSTSWSELLKPFTLGLLSEEEVQKDIESLEGTYLIRLEDERSFAKIVTGLVKWKQTNETCFKIDTDFYNNNKFNREEVFDTLNYLHLRASRLIQWIITPRLHEALEPKTL